MKQTALAALIILAAATAPAQTVVDPSLTVDTVVASAGGLAQPTNMAFIAANDILINEKATGRVRRVTNGVVQAGNVLDLPVNSASERGLLGMALHPQFASNGFVYLFHTAAATDGGTPIDNRVSRFTWNGTALTNEQVIKQLPVLPGPNHDGGIIIFGPPNAAPADQKLFIIIGDLNLDGQTENYASGSAPDNHAVVLRINPDGSTPTDGPFYSIAGANSALQTMFAYGIRNSYGMDFDPITNALWDSENGPGSNDEVNRIDPAFNSGWERVMGFTATPPATLVQFSGVGTYSNPEFTWESVVAPTAIHFYRGTTLGAGYQYDCIVGSNNNSGRLYKFEVNGPRTGFSFTDANLTDNVLNTGQADTEIRFGNNFGPVTDIRTGPDGNLYVLAIDTPGGSYGDGALYRIRPAQTSVDQWGLYE